MTNLRAKETTVELVDFCLAGLEAAEESRNPVNEAKLERIMATAERIIDRQRMLGNG